VNYVASSNQCSKLGGKKRWILCIFRHECCFVTFALCHRKLVLSSVCNVVAPYQEGWTFRQYFCTV